MSRESNKSETSEKDTLTDEGENTLGQLPSEIQDGESEKNRKEEGI